MGAGTVFTAEAPGPQPDQGLHQVATQLKRADRGTQCIGHVQHLLHHGQRGGLGEGRQMATAITLVDGTTAGAPLQGALAQVVAPDAVVAGHRDVQLVVGNGQADRMVQRDLPRLRDRPFHRRTGSPVATQGVDDAGQQVDTAHRVVAGVGDVQRIALQYQRLRAVECRFGEVAVHEIGGAEAELTQDAAAMAAFENAVMAAVGDVQAFGADRQPLREAQGLARFRMQFAAATRRRRRCALAQRVQGALQFTGRALPDQPLLFAALRVQQHHGRPGGDAEAAPTIPVGIEQHGHAQALTAQQLQCGRGIAFEIKTRHLQHQRLQLAGMARQPLAELGQALRAPGGGRIDEQQRDRPAAQFGQGAGGGVEPGGELGQVRDGLDVHDPIMPESASCNSRATARFAASSTSDQTCSK